MKCSPSLHNVSLSYLLQSSFTLFNFEFRHKPCKDRFDSSQFVQFIIAILITLSWMTFVRTQRTVCFVILKTLYSTRQVYQKWSSCYFSQNTFTGTEYGYVLKNFPFSPILDWFRVGTSIIKIIFFNPGQVHEFNLTFSTWKCVSCRKVCSLIS